MSGRTGSYRKSAVDSLFKVIVELSDEEALAIANLLESVIAADSLSDSIREHVKLRRLERRVSSRRQRLQGTLAQRKRTPKPALQSTIDLSAGQSTTSREFASLINEVFGNRKQFKSTIDVINSIDQLFGLRFEYEKYKKSGRRKLLLDLRRNLESMPDKEREKKLASLIQWLEKDGSSEGDYKRLVRILTGHD